VILGSLAKNLLAGARLALFLPVRAWDYRASPADYAALLAFNLALWVGVAWIQAGGEGEFNPLALAVYLASVPVVLATSALVATAFGAPAQLLLIATALTASDFVFELAALAFPAFAGELGPLAGFAVLAWLWLTALRAVRVCGGARGWPVAKGALAVTAMIAVGLFAFPRADVWVLPEEAPAAEPLAGEALFHRQGRLIEEALAAIRPGRAGRPELYFVGFAPDASQDVFLREMRFVKQQFEGRFGAAGRSIVLASSSDALEEFPIGSATNLARSLARVGEAMNADEDVLLLLLSAHGDREHRLSAWQPPLELAPVTPTALARMLQDAGIKWRVIVVSACFAGGYLEPLRDDNTLVITASAADRHSFGCETGRDSTYFGQAYFRTALEKTRSFIDAFDISRRLVDEQEKKEGLQPSQPQLWAGPAIAAKLKQLGDAPDKQ
jgi:hypothetical protein